MYYIAYSNFLDKDKVLKTYNAKFIKNINLYGYKIIFDKQLKVIRTGNDKDYVPCLLWDVTDEIYFDLIKRIEHYPMRKEFENITDNEMEHVYIEHNGQYLDCVLFINTKLKYKYEKPEECEISYFIKSYRKCGLDEDIIWKALQECMEKEYEYVN